MATKLHLEIVTPTRKVVDADVDEVRLPGSLGELGALPGHTPLLTSLGTGVLAYTADGKEEVFAIQAGFAEILEDNVTILAETAERPDQIDLAAAQAARDEAEAALKEAAAEQIDELTASLRLAQTRLSVAGRT